MKELNITQIQKIETYLLKKTIEVFEENNINYTMYAGSILGTIRHSGPIPWDTDIDIIVSIDDLEKVKRAFENLPSNTIYIEYYPKNKKYSHCYPRVCIKGVDSFWVHIDIFLYSALPENTDLCNQFLLTAFNKLKMYQRKCDIIFKKSNVFENLLRTIYHWVRSRPLGKSKQALFSDYFNYVSQYPLSKASYTAEIGCLRYGTKKVYPKSFWTQTIERNYDGISVKIPMEYDGFLKTLYGDYMQLPSIEEQKKYINKTFIVEDDLYNWCIENKVLSL